MREAGVGVMVKLDTLTITVIVWLSKPLVPTTSMVYVPGIVLVATEMLRLAPADDVMVETLNDGVRSTVDGNAMRLAFPENPFRSISVIVEFEVEPAGILREEGVALREKSGPVTVTEIIT